METHTAIEIYESVSKPPKSMLKEITGGKLKGKTDINPQWRYRIMTEKFGLVGVGWKYEIQRLWTEKGSGEEILAFAQIAVSIKQGSTWSEPVTGVGGSKIVQIEKDRLVSNDEGYKMAITDAIGTALKMLGVAASVYEGRWNGSKYIDDPLSTTPQKGQKPVQPQKSQNKNSGQSLKGGQSTPEEQQEINDILTKTYENGQPVFSDAEKIQYKKMRKEKTAQEVIGLASEAMEKRLEAYRQNYNDTPGVWH